MLAGIEGQRDGHNAEAASSHSDHLRRCQFAIHQRFDFDIAVSAVVFSDEVDFKGLARLENFFRFLLTKVLAMHIELPTDVRQSPY